MHTRGVCHQIIMAIVLHYGRSRPDYSFQGRGSEVSMLHEASVTAGHLSVGDLSWGTLVGITALVFHERSMVHDLSPRQVK